MIPFQRKAIQMQQKIPTPKQSLRLFNSAYPMGKKVALCDPAYWHTILIQGHGKILKLLWRPAFYFICLPAV